MIGECEVGRGADYYDLDSLNGKLFFKDQRSWILPPPSDTHHHEMKFYH